MSLPLQYAVLHHTGIDQPHYDLLFETQPGSLLATFRCDRWPIPPGTVLTERLPDHRRIYLEYEGPISRNRGEVRRVARGTCRLIGMGNRTQLRLDTGEQFELAEDRSTGNPSAGA